MFRLTVSDVFVIRGRGLVATGKVESGTLRVGDTVLVDGGRRLHVDGIEAFRKVLDAADEGMNIGVLFKELSREDLPPGSVLTDADGGFAPPPPPPPSAGADARFGQVEALRTQLLSMREAGITTDAQIAEQLAAAQIVAGTRTWRLGADGHWLASDGGGAFSPATPPA